ncbi:hypothetical protein BCF74_13713 [Knoellia remsis]|uniref:Uncharacterized protein n=1 Tax=Knoellia remsis TaxID=407159 RepID=A0A2T0TZ32_9MICO|nr:hypothetical protein [Knoellia remsis]PRY50932.1 hypothetical protein BCF74_13713 [Knoellia remsis]
MRESRALALVAAIAALTACTGNETAGGAGGPTVSAHSARSPVTSSTPTPTPPSDTASPASTTRPSSSAASPAPGSSGSPRSGIRAVDFGDLTWRDPVNPSARVTLRDGRASGPAGLTWSVDDTPRYLDIDGDGDEDALVTLVAEEGNGYQETRSAWLWDASSDKPRQVVPGLTLDERCGNVTEEVRLTKPNTFSVTRLVRGEEICAEKPTAQTTSTIRVRDEFAWQIAPTVTALMCPYREGRGLGFPGSDFGDDGPRAWADDDAPVMLTGKDIQAMDLDDSREGVPRGWNRILFIRSDSDKSDTSPPCGYFPAS